MSAREGSSFKQKRQKIRLVSQVVVGRPAVVEPEYCFELGFLSDTGGKATAKRSTGRTVRAATRGRSNARRIVTLCHACRP